MLARHPKTGAPIRIMTSNSSTWKSTKTLVWLNGLEDMSKPWNRWDVGASNMAAWNTLMRAGLPVDVCCLLGDIKQCIGWLEHGHAESCKIIAAPKDLIQALGIKRLSELNITNMICLEEVLDLYPFLEKPWDGSEADARAILALILQYGYTFPVIEGPHTSVADTLGLKISETLSAPVPLYFITQYYVPPNTKRAKEIDRCLQMNEKCPYIDKIILLNESMLEISQGFRKIEQYNIGKRLTFAEVFMWIYKNAPNDALICIANSDIYLDESWRQMWSINMNSTFFALLRWDEQTDTTLPPKLFGPRSDSQDTWVISAKAVKSRVWNWDSLDFPFGKGGCDNAITIEMLRQKFFIVNPCMSLITHHVHNTSYRTYDPADIVSKPVLMYVNPSGLHDLNPEINIIEPIVKSYSIPSFPLNIKGSLTSQQSTTLFTMLSKDSDIVLKNGVNLYNEFKIPIYEFKNVFQLSTGLLRTYSSILVGTSQACSNAWSKEEVSIAAASVCIDIGLVAPCPDEIANNPVRYMLEYMGKIFALRKLNPKGEWLGVKDSNIVDALKLFTWENDTIPVVVRTPAFQTWCKKAYAWLPQDDSHALVTSVEIAALREALYEWSPTPTKNTIIIYVDNNWITDTSVELFEKALKPFYNVSCIYSTTQLSIAIQMLNGAQGIITYSGKNSIHRWGTLWALPLNAFIWEIQPETEPSLDLHHLSSVSGLHHNLHIVPRTTATSNDINKMVDSVVRAISKGDNRNPSVEIKALTPFLLMPHKDTKGFFAHAGDSFREVAEMWGEKGYVNLKYVEGLTQIWLGSVGDTLLYDRPTLEWLERAPPSEKDWTKAYFGNPAAPIINASTSAWSFWPRRPRLLEDLLTQGIGSSTQRPLGLVFYGRSENSVQLGRRSTKDWSSVCDEFVHIVGDKPYPYTQRAYLLRLSNAKWGLCLAGYGNKCHREIECMALGCVPIVSQEVDMTNYINPPIEGLHYFRVNGPEDVQAILETPHEVWVKSSNACKEWYKINASPDGLWSILHDSQKN
jgi:hypothetical protein